jgi:hypothetical protein
VAVGAGAAAAPSAEALALAGAPAAVIPGQKPSALTMSSAVTGLSGVKGGVSIETFLMKSLPLRENHSASDENISDEPAQPAIMGANRSNASTRFPRRYLSCTMK